LFQAYFFGREPPGTIRQVLGETLAAHIVTLPIIALTFGTVSNVAIFANLFIVPLVPLAMIGTFLAGVVGLIAPGVAEWVGLPVSWLLGYMIWVAEWFAELPWAQKEVSFEPWVTIVYVIILIGLCWLAQRHTGYSLRSSSIVD
jgi:competence protein ComEC